MRRYSANKVLIFVFVEISINFVANYTTFSLRWTRKHGIVTIAEIKHGEQLTTKILE